MAEIKKLELTDEERKAYKIAIDRIYAAESGFMVTDGEVTARRAYIWLGAMTKMLAKAVAMSAISAPRNTRGNRDHGMADVLLDAIERNVACGLAAWLETLPQDEIGRRIFDPTKEGG